MNKEIILVVTCSIQWFYPYLAVTKGVQIYLLPMRKSFRSTSLLKHIAHVKACKTYYGNRFLLMKESAKKNWKPKSRRN